MKVNRQNMMDQQKKRDISTKEEEAYLGFGVAVHSQVTKIKQEMDNINHPSQEQQEQPPEIIRQVFHDIAKRQQRCRSPLGIPQRPFSLGNS